MNIKNIKVNAYGILQEKEISLGSHINIIYGKNESGKSTLLNFIKSSFYGINKTKNKKEISDYDKYMPWYTEEFSGKISYQLDDGEEYQVYRDFRKKAPKIYNKNLEEITNQFVSDKKDGNRFFTEHTNLEEDMFLSTIVTMQGETKLNEQAQAILVQKLANLAGTGNDNLSYKKVIEKLNKRQIEEVGTERTLERPINLVSHKIEKLEKEIEDLKWIHTKKEELEKEKNQIQEKIQEKEIYIQAIKEIESYLKEFELKKEKIKIKRKELEYIQSEINQIINEKNNLDNHKINPKSKKILKLIIALMGIILFGMVFFIPNKFLKIIFAILAVLAFISIFIIIGLEKKQINKMKKERNKNRERIDNKEEYLKISEKEMIDQIAQNEKEQDEKNDQMIEKIHEKYQEYINKKDILELFEKENNIKLYNQLIEEINTDKVKYNSFVYQQNNIRQDLEELPQKEESLWVAKEEKEELIEKNKNINLAKELLQKAYEKMQNNVTPKLTNNLSKNMNKISNGKYEKVVINSENKILIEDTRGQYIPIERLSMGTIDQMYLSLRLSMINELSSEKMPIILDETFAYFDEERLKNVLAFLAMELKNNQVIIFTCSEREKKILDQLQLEYNFINLSEKNN